MGIFVGTATETAEAHISGEAPDAVAYALAVGTPVAVTLLFLAYVYVSTTSEEHGTADTDAVVDEQEEDVDVPRDFDYVRVGNQIVVTYEGEGTWDSEGLVVRYTEKADNEVGRANGDSDSGGGKRRTVARFDTTNAEVERGDGLSINADAVDGEIEVLWDGEVVDVHRPG